MDLSLWGRYWRSLPNLPNSPGYGPVMVPLASKLELWYIFWRNFYSQRTHVAKSMLLICTNMAKDTCFKSFICCANKYAKKEKEKEKNTAVFTNCHGGLLMIISNIHYLFNNMLVYSVTKGQFLALIGQCLRWLFCQNLIRIVHSCKITHSSWVHYYTWPHNYSLP